VVEGKGRRGMERQRKGKVEGGVMEMERGRGEVEGKRGGEREGGGEGGK
jgi:hypothetical protein